jgi:hypothetical protein
MDTPALLDRRRRDPLPCGNCEGGNHALRRSLHGRPLIIICDDCYEKDISRRAYDRAQRLVAEHASANH